MKTLKKSIGVVLYGRATKKKFWLAMFAGIIFAFSPIAVHACIDYLGPLSGGASVYASCGGSSGNYIYVCDEDGCYEDSSVQLEAQIWCMMPESCNHRNDPIEDCGICPLQ
jgi:hypothetical protein